MSSALRLLPCFALLLTLSGCGGTSNTGSSGSPPGGGGNTSPTTVTFSFFETGAQPVAVATQIGTGAYMLATPTSGKVTLSIPHGQTNFSVAYICPLPFGNNPTENNVNITQASTLDGTSFYGTCSGANSGTGTSTGLATAQVNAAAIVGGEMVSIEGQSLPWSASTLDFSETFPVGTYDIPVAVTAYSTDLPIYLAVKILRSQTVPGALNGGAPIVFQTSDETLPQTLTYNNVPDGFTPGTTYITYQTAGGADINYSTGTQPGQYLAIPSSEFQTGDYYVFSAVASNSTNNQSVRVEKIPSNNGPQSFTFPAPWSYAGPTPAALPTFNFEYPGFSGLSNVVEEAYISWVLGNNTTGYIYDTIAISATANYLNGATSVTIPDLSALAGFLAPPTSNTQVNWFAAISQSSFTDGKPPSGTLQSVSANGNYIVP